MRIEKVAVVFAQGWLAAALLVQSTAFHFRTVKAWGEPLGRLSVEARL